MRRFFKTALLAILTMTIAGGTIASNADTLTEPTGYNDTLALQQRDPAWGEHVAPGCTDNLGTISCGALSVVNCVRFLTDYVINPIELVDYLVANGCLSDEGLYRYETYVENSPLDKFLKEHDEIPAEFSQYLTETTNMEDIKPYLQAGCACIIHVPGHFLCVAAYDEESDRYLVLDSSAGSYRGTSACGTWQSAEKYSSGDTFNMTDFCAFKAKGEKVSRELPSTDNSDSDFTDSISILSGSGEAYFTSNKSTMATMKAGEKYTIKVVPADGYRCGGIQVGTDFVEPKKNGKTATYTFTQPAASIEIQVMFTDRYETGCGSSISAAALPVIMVLLCSVFWRWREKEF